MHKNYGNSTKLSSFDSDNFTVTHDIIVFVSSHIHWHYFHVRGINLHNSFENTFILALGQGICALFHSLTPQMQRTLKRYSSKILRDTLQFFWDFFLLSFKDCFYAVFWLRYFACFSLFWPVQNLINSEKQLKK